MTVADTRTFGPYEIVRRLGVGGMAETFLALRRGLHGVEQRVCLKRVLPAFAADPSFLRQFEREASIASTLRYTGIVAVVEFGDVEGAKYLALELVDGIDLRDYLASRPGQKLDPTTVARLALDLGYSLRYAHDPVRAVVHRDVSPANVMLSRTGEVKLADFDVARVMSSAAPTTSTGVRGKIAYMCPEHLRGEELDGRADLFALGVLLYECLCGQRPFYGAHDVEIMRRVAAGERPHVREFAPSDTPAALLAAIEGLLATDRDARTPDATALIDSVDAEVVAIRSAVVQPEPFAFTITGRDANVLVFVENTGPTPLRIRVLTWNPRMVKLPCGVASLAGMRIAKRVSPDAAAE